MSHPYLDNLDEWKVKLGALPRANRRKKMARVCYPLTVRQESCSIENQYRAYGLRERTYWNPPALRWEYRRRGAVYMSGAGPQVCVVHATRGYWYFAYILKYVGTPKERAVLGELLVLRALAMLKEYREKGR